jgi:hypothetical protein
MTAHVVVLLVRRNIPGRVIDSWSREPGGTYLLINDDGTKTVTFAFNPKCLDDPTPCGLASQSVTAVVDCTTNTATCPQ